MNMKRITDVPVIEELGENSYVLVNNNGEAAQISGSKVGGGGGGELPMLKGEFVFGDDEDVPKYVAITYEDGSPIDYATAKPILFQRPMYLDYVDGDDRGYQFFAYLDFYENKKLADAAVFWQENMIWVDLHFSDTPEDPWAEE